ncbi:MAG: transcriptional regulator [Firmicutes bacterium]|nr:transcriptional regulator [Bacillota bacterium]
MEFLRIGDKIISLEKIRRAAEQALKLRSQGLSQQEVAKRLQLDRTFISRLETLGEIRKGGSIALFGFPVKNKEEIVDLARQAGVDFIWLMNDKERWQLVKERSGLEFLNVAMDIISQLRSYQTVILIGSKKWLRLGEALLDGEVFYIDLGGSPIEKDCYLDPDSFKQILRDVCG